MQDIDAAVPKNDPRKRRLSLVWLMPILAVVVAAGVVWRNYQNQGPIITVTFPSAGGIKAGTTELRFLDLKVGLVEDISIADDLRSVDAHIRLENEIADFVDADASFWLVQPRVSARGVEGLGTVLSGVYIGATWDAVAGARQDQFAALATPPLSTGADEGTQIVLRTRAGGQLAAGAPILFNGFEVGRIGTPVLSESGVFVTMDAFISAPHDQRLTTNARFWDASGLSVNVGATGLSVNIGSIAALIEGGLNFGLPVAGGAPVEAGHVFDVFPTEAAARANVFAGDPGPRVQVSAVLSSDLSGLSLETPVRFRGLGVGEVVDFSGVTQDDGQIGLRVDLALAADRLDLPEEDPLAALERLIEVGLRARVGSEGLLGQTVVLELALLPQAAPATLSSDAEGRLLLPVVAPVDAAENSGLENLIARAQALPIEALATSASEAIAGIAALVNQSDTQSLPAAVQDFLGSATALAEAPEITSILRTTDGTLSDLRGSGAIEGLNRTLASAEGAVVAIESAVASLPGITARLDSAVRALEGTVGGYAPDSRFHTELRETLREFTSAAEALRSLARTIERDPNVLITGR